MMISKMKANHYHVVYNSLGLCAEGCSSSTFPLIMGTSKASEMLMLNHKMSSTEALQFGFVSQVYKNESDIWDKLKQIDKLPLGSIVANKKLLRGPLIEKLMKVNDNELLELSLRLESEEAMEAIINFQMSRKSKL